MLTSVSRGYTISPTVNNNVKEPLTVWSDKVWRDPSAHPVFNETEMNIVLPLFSVRFSRSPWGLLILVCNGKCVAMLHTTAAFVLKGLKALLVFVLFTCCSWVRAAIAALEHSREWAGECLCASEVCANACGQMAAWYVILTWSNDQKPSFEKHRQHTLQTLEIYCYEKYKIGRVAW